jgi:hypothetical protein
MKAIINLLEIQQITEVKEYEHDKNRKENAGLPDKSE